MQTYKKKDMGKNFKQLPVATMHLFGVTADIFPVPVLQQIHQQIWQTSLRRSQVSYKNKTRTDTNIWDTEHLSYLQAVMLTMKLFILDSNTSQMSDLDLVTNLPG